MNRERVTITVATIVAVLVGGLVGYFAADAAKTQATKDTRLVKEVCDYSRGIHSGKWEEACGNLQDATNPKYSCKNYNDGTFCIVEEK